MLVIITYSNFFFFFIRLLLFCKIILVLFILVKIVMWIKILIGLGNVEDCFIDLKISISCFKFAMLSHQQRTGQSCSNYYFTQACCIRLLPLLSKRQIDTLLSNEKQIERETLLSHFHLMRLL